MGSSHSLMDDLVQFRMTAKQMGSSARKCEKNAESERKKLEAAIKKKNKETARIYGENAIREKKQAVNYLRLQGRIDAVANRLDAAIKMQEINKTMNQTVRGMSNAMKAMNVDQITSTMDDFESAFADMEGKSAFMEAAMETSTASGTPADEVDALIQLVTDEAGLENILELNEAQEGTHMPATAQTTANTENDLEKRLAALRK